METLICNECGTSFKCGSTPTNSCWCTQLPNLRGSFDLAGSCVCPACLTMGQSKAIIKQRKEKQKHRAAIKKAINPS